MGGLALTLVGDPVSRGYLDLTLEVLAAFSVRAHVTGAVVVVPAGPPRATRFVVEPDASSAAVWWAAAALVGGRVVVPGLSTATRQPDAALLPVLARMGARVTSSPAGEAIVTASGERLVGAGDVDLRASPDLAPLVAALAAGADGETRVVHAPHLRLKESDRIAACVAAVKALHGDATEAADGFVVRGRALAGGVVDVAGDHRLALAFGVLGLSVSGVVLAGAEAVTKSYPGFFAELAARAGAPA
jgi:3-phosphoshikimate 1-carboxyvinyltransferase